MLVAQRIAHDVRTSLKACLALFAIGLSAGPLEAQAGKVLGEQKITEGVGGFAGPLGDDYEFGTAVAYLGDLDNDGVGDVAVGAPRDDDGAMWAGAVWILFLNADGTVKAEQRISNSSGNFGGTLGVRAEFGGSLAGLGDLDGDGVEDLATGADYYNDIGSVWILFLNTDGTVKSELEITEGTAGFTGDLARSSLFGVTLAHLGDLDSDGTEELAVGATGSDPGEIWILSLNTNGTVAGHSIISDGVGGFGGNTVGAGLGTALARLDDLDGNGVPELVAGAFGDDEVGSNSGAIWVMFLDSTSTVIDEQKIGQNIGGLAATWNDSGLFGSSVGALGDLDNDALPDLIVGAFGDNEAGTGTGAAWTLLMNADGTVKSHVKINGLHGGLVGPVTAGDFLGRSAAGIGDLNGDGRLDAIVGSHQDDQAGTQHGSVYVTFLDGATATTWDGSESGDWDDPDNWSNGVPTRATHAFVTNSGSTCNTSAATSPTCADLTLSSGTLEVDGDLIVNGTMTLGGDSLDIASGTLTVLGDVNLTSGTLVGAGTLDCDGNIDFQVDPGGSPPPIFLSGDYSAFGAPTTNLSMTLDGSALQDISSAGYAGFQDLEIVTGADVQSSTFLLIAGELILDGALETTNLDIQGTLSGTDGTLNCTAPGNTIAGDFLLGGTSSAVTSSSPIIFAGTGAVWNSTATLPDVRINSAGATISGSGLHVTGDLSMPTASGTFDVQSGAVLRVDGVAQFEAGTWTGAGTLDLNGATTFELASIDLGNPPATIQCSASLDIEGSLSLPSGTLVLDASGSQTVTYDTDPLQLSSLDVVAGNLAVVSGPGEVELAGSLNIDGQMNLIGPTLDIEGSVTGSGDLGCETTRVAGDYSLSGLVLGSAPRIFFDGVTQNITSTGLPEVNVSSSGFMQTGAVHFVGTNAVNGDLKLLTFSDTTVSGTVTVTGNLEGDGDFGPFQDPVLSGSGVVDVDGSVNLQYCNWPSPPDLELTGNLGGFSWFLGAGQVTFDGIVPQTLGGLSPSIGDILVAGTADLAISGFTQLSDLEVEPGARASIDGTVGIEDLVLDGELTAASGSVSVSGTFSGTGALDVNSSASFSGDYSFEGTLPGHKTLTFVGAGQNVTSSSLTDVLINASGAVNFTGSSVMTSLELNSGDVTIGGGGTTTVGGLATFAGGSLAGGGTLVLQGDALFSGTTVNSPDIEIAGDLTIDENWDPMSGTVTFNGGGGQEIFLGGTATQAPFFAMSVADSADVTAGASVPVVTSDALTVAGALTLDGGIDADGEVTGPATGNLTVAPPIHFGGGLSLQGSLNATGMVVFDGAGPNFVTVDTDFGSADVDVDMDPGATLTFSAEIILIGGDLNLNEGELVVTGDNETTVGGDSNYLGGSLSGDGLIKTLGNVTFGGTTMNSPDLEVSGSFTHDENFAPQSGTVKFAGSSPQPISTTGAATAATFYGLTIAPNAVVTSLVELRADGPATIDTGSSLTVTPNIKFGHNLVVKGSLQTSTMVVFDGGGYNTVQAIPPAKLPTVDVAKDEGGVLVFEGEVLDIEGLLNLVSGTLEVADGTGVDVTGAGVSTFSGGFLRSEGSDDISSGVIHFDEDVNFTGSMVFTPPDIELEGDWSSDENFLPTLGRVTFNGEAASPQILTVTGAAPEALFSHLVVAANARVEHLVSIHTKGLCTANGQLICSNPSDGSPTLLDIDEELEGTGTVDFGSTTPNLGGLTFTGTAIGLDAVNFDGSGTNVVNTNLTLPDVTVSGSGTLSVTSDLTISGALIIDDGDFDLAPLTTTTAMTASLTGGAVSGEGMLVTNMALIINAPGDTVTFDGDGLTIESDLHLLDGTLDVVGETTVVNGSATFEGGELTGDGVLDVMNDVTFSGTAATTPCDFEIGGDWTADASWAPTTGTVSFDGTLRQLVMSSVSPILFYGFCVLADAEISLMSPLQVDGPFTAEGDFSTTSSVDLNGGLGGGGDLTLTSAPLNVGGDFTFDGTLDGPSLVVLDGSGNHVLDTDLGFTDLTVDSAGSYSIQGLSLSVLGNFALDAGAVTVQLENETDIAGTASFSGGSLTSLGLIDVEGNTTFDTTSVSGELNLETSGSIWESDLAFAPTGGKVTFDGTGTQSVSVAQSSFSFADLEIGTDSQVATTKSVATSGSLTVLGDLATTGTTLTVGGHLDVDGVLDAATATLDVAGDFDLDPSGSMTIGAGPHTFGASYAELGTLAQSGAFLFTAGAPAVIDASGDFALPGITFDGAGPFDLSSGGAVTVSGDLAVIDGSFGLNDPLSVSGRADFTGGTWDGATSALDVAGDVTFGGTLAGGSYDIDCGGDWTADTSFAPTGGTITLDGITDSDMTPSVTDADLLFHDLVIAGGKRTVQSLGRLAVRSLSIGVGAELDSGSALTEVSTGPLLIDGALRVSSGGELALAPSVAASVSSTGALGLLADWPAEARIRGLGGSGYSFSVAGALAAMNFRIEEVGPSGFEIASTASIAPAPNDLRGGTFDLPSATPGSLLLDVSRPAPTTFEYLVFEDTLAQGTFNVGTTPGSADISLRNFSGAFSGESFDDDGGDQIQWLAPAATAISAFDAVSKPGRVVLTWTTSSEVNAIAFLVERQKASGGPYVVIGEVDATGPSSYSLLDTNLLAGSYSYRLSERLTHGAIQSVASTSVEVASGGAAGPIAFKVGASDGTSAIADTLLRVERPNSTIAVGAGVYDSFRVGSDMAPGLRIVATEPGVRIDTTTGPVRIEGLLVGQSLELSGLELMAPPTDHPALLITGSQGVVLLDELTAHGGLNNPAVRVEDSSGIALQSVNLGGSPALALFDSRQVFVRTGQVADAVLVDSELSLLNTDTAIETEGASHASSLTANPTQLIFDRSAAPGVAHELVLETPENVAWVLLAAPDLGWLEWSAPTPLLLDVRRAAPFGSGTAPTESTVIQITPPSDLGLLGRRYLLQAVSVDTTTGIPALSNVRSLGIDG